MSARYAFRFDDITPGMRWAPFERLVQCFDVAGVRPLIGVVPDNRDPELELEQRRPDFWDVVRQLRQRGWSIAQHGFQHIYVNCDPGMLGVSRNSEFAGLPYDEQRHKIERGRQILSREGLETDVWMAPSHSYDLVTLRALRDSGFRIITDGYTPFPYDAHGLRFIPCQMALPRALPAGTVTVCLHTNTMTERHFQLVENFVRTARSRVVDFADLCRAPARGAWNRALERGILSARAAVRSLR